MTASRVSVSLAASLNIAGDNYAVYRVLFDYEQAV